MRDFRLGLGGWKRLVRWWGVCTWVVAMFSGCVPSVPGGGDGVDDGGDDGGGENPPGFVTLEINIIGTTGVETFSRVAYFVGDAIRDSHDNAGSRECTKFDTAPATCSVQVELGKTVTVFAIESISGSTQNFSGSVSTDVPPDAVEFVRAVDCDSALEPHSCAVVMDRDKSVTFEYRRMNAVLVRGLGFPRSIHIQVTGDTPDTYGIPSYPDAAVGSDGEFPFSSTTLTPAVKLWAKSGTTYVFEYEDWRYPLPEVAPNDYSRFLSWGGDCELMEGTEPGTTACSVVMNGVDLSVDLNFEYFLCGSIGSSGNSDIGCPETPSCRPVPERECFIGPDGPVGPPG